MALRQVIALMSVQRHPVAGGERTLLKAGTPFEVEIGSEEEKQLEEMNAIRDAKSSDLAKAHEDGRVPIVRRPRFRTRREIRAVQDAERDLADRGLDPGTGRGTERSAVKSSDTVVGSQNNRAAVKSTDSLKGKRGGVL